MVKSTTNNKFSIITASGGIVWRITNKKKLIAIIHRPQYQDWCLPKGKCEPNETFAETALREVKEELGCACRILDLAGVNYYRFNDGYKLVVYWNMCFGTEIPNSVHKDEVDKILWLKPQAAIKRLDYKADKEILKKNLKYLEKID